MIGTVVWLAVFSIVDLLIHPALLNASAEAFGIAIAHSIFNVLCTILLLPMTGLLETIANKVIREPAKKEKVTELDERLLATPPIALERCAVVAGDMAKVAAHGMKDALMSITSYNKTLAESVYECEDKCDHYEDILGTYLVKLSGSLSGQDSNEAAKLLRIIGDFERISDHSKDIVKASEELQEKGMAWSASFKRNFCGEKLFSKSFLPNHFSHSKKDFRNSSSVPSYSARARNSRPSWLPQL